MIWYIALYVLAIIFGLIVFVSLAIVILSGFDMSGLLIFFLITAILCGLCFWGVNEIDDKHTTTSVETIQMEIVKLDLTETYSRGLGTQTNYHMSVANGSEEMCFIFNITSNEYVKYNIGDLVEVEVTTTTNNMHKTTHQTANLKGGN
jgi:hypothetical protein